MKFENAVHAMKLGQRVRLKSWVDGKYVKITEHFVPEYIGDWLATADAKFTLAEILSDEWEIFGEKEEEFTVEMAVNRLISLRTAVGFEIPVQTLPIPAEEFIKAIDFAVREIQKKCHDE